MQKKDTVVFDLDGTLLDTLEDLKNSVNYALEQFGYPTHTLEDVRRFVGNGITRLMELSLPSGQDNPDFDAVLECFKKHYGIHCNDLTKPYDGIMELLHELKERGIKMAIVSNKADFAVKELNDIYFQEVIPLAVGEREARVSAGSPRRILCWKRSDSWRVPSNRLSMWEIPRWILPQPKTAVWITSYVSGDFGQESSWNRLADRCSWKGRSRFLT